MAVFAVGFLGLTLSAGHVRLLGAARAEGPLAGLRRRGERQRGEGRVPDGFGGSGRDPGPPVMETLTMAKESFRVAGIADYKIDIGHVGIIKGIFEEMSLTEEKKSQIISLISEKNLVELENEVSALPLDSGSKEIICRLPCLFGKPEDVFKGMDEIIVNKTVKESVEYLLQIYGKCKDLGLGSNIIIDAGMTGNMKYYTGLIFKAYARGAGDVVISGGRYDGSLKEMGSDAAASGFAIYIDNMLEAVTEKFEEQKGSKVLVIFSESRFIEALKYSESRRNNGTAVNMVNRGDISDPEQYRRQYDCSEVVIFE